MRQAFTRKDPQKFLDIRFFDMLGEPQHVEEDGRGKGFENQKIVLLVVADLKSLPAIALV
jgi:hypothetical protein